MKGNRAEQSKRLNLLCGGKAMAMDNLIIVRRVDGTTEWLFESDVAYDSWRWAPTGNEYGVQFQELYSE